MKRRMYCTVGNDRQNQSRKVKRGREKERGRKGATVSEAERLDEDAITQTEPKSFDNIYKEEEKKTLKNSIVEVIWTALYFNQLLLCSNCPRKHLWL